MSQDKRIGVPFPKGVSGNPNGRPKMPDDVKRAKTLNRIALERLLNRFIHMTREDLAYYAKDPKASAMELLIASIVSRAIIKGDHVRADFLLNRLVGKVPDKIDATINNPFATLTDEEKLEKAKEVVALLEQKVARPD